MLEFQAPSERAASSAPLTDCPLLVDVDGCLVRTDLLWEGIARMAMTCPSRLPGMAPALVGGRASLKAYVKRHAPLALDTLPLDEDVLALIANARAIGQPVLLVSGSDAEQVGALRDRVNADGAIGSDGVVNLVGRTKLESIRSRFLAFDYVGNALVDLPIWRAADHAYAVNTAPWTRWLARRSRNDLVLLGSARTWPALWRSMRIHQWAKNLLIPLPAMAAHLPLTLALALQLLAGIAAFSLMASAVYILNDIADLDSDRRHETKRRRPFASGQLGIPTGLAAAAVLVAGAAAIALRLPPDFQWILAGYAALTSLYSLALKRVALLDVVTLATLYTARIVAGAALVQVPLTQWFLGFAIFFFLSLALAKRAVELQRMGASTETVRGRGYSPADLPVIVAFGAGSAVASALVYCLYITGSEVSRLYPHPMLLWLGLPILLYWIGRVWMLTLRGAMRDDPVVFALRDGLSKVTFIAFLIVVVAASHHSRSHGNSSISPHRSLLISLNS
ncbi:MAG TPA: UbiA family prenyltransferase [Gemmatimonadaceae bacterium]